MILNGKRFAENMLSVLKGYITDTGRSLQLGVLVFQRDAATEQFTRMKKEAGETVGVTVDIIECQDAVTTEEAVGRVHEYAEKYDGIIVQLPLPSSIDTEKVLSAIPASKDVDGIGGQQHADGVLPPVVAAIREILSQYNIEPKDMRVVVVGKGRLVGTPAAVWFRKMGAYVEIATRSTKDLAALTQTADIVVLGAGVPALLTADMVCEGVVVLDAGSGEVGGRVVGDAEESIAEKAALFTPTPGGIGPVAVAMIFVNLYMLATGKKY